MKKDGGNNDNQDRGRGTATDTNDGSGGSGGPETGGISSIDTVLSIIGNDSIGTDSNGRDPLPIDARDTSGLDPTTSSGNGNIEHTDTGSDRRKRRNRYRSGSKREATRKSTGEPTSADDTQKGQSSGQTEEAPNSVNFNDLLKSVGLGEDLSLDEAALSKAVQFLSLGPEFLGYGDHWPVNKKQADTFAKAWGECYKSLGLLEDSTLAKLAGYAKKSLPWLAALWVTHTIFTPRLEQTRLLMAEKEKREQYARFQQFYGPRPGSNGAVSNQENTAATNEPVSGARAGEPASRNDYEQFTKPPNFN